MSMKRTRGFFLNINYEAYRKSSYRDIQKEDRKSGYRIQRVPLTEYREKC
jgi:hypothetical protein